jgi:lipopolysaccharide/colanic/teichoic acid biosynthesis glycosyltransferase
MDKLAAHSCVLASPFARTLRSLAAKARWWLQARAPDAVKRMLDLVLVVPALVLLLPLFTTVALAIWFGDRGPVLHWQQRVGRGGRVFRFPKFRSMRVDADAVRQQLLASNQHGSQGVTFKMRSDPRITRVGRFIRRASIDELPQLWSVLRGDMSLVGPRPPLCSEVARYSQTDRERLAVTPGLTCIWQVNGRSEVPFPQQVQMDLQYIRDRGLRTDIALLLRTVPAVIKGRGAY